MPAGQPSWIKRTLGLALSRQLLRRSLTLQGAIENAALSTIISRAATGGAGCTAGMPVGLHQPELSSTESAMSNESLSFKEWAAKLSQPSVELRVPDDHVTLEEAASRSRPGSLSGETDLVGSSADWFAAVREKFFSGSGGRRSRTR